MRTHQIIIILGLIAVASCSSMRANPELSPLARAEHDRLAFVQAACGGCHAVEAPGLSRNPQAPTFEAIANRSGLSEDTLAAWLADAHNYPEVMDFDLDPSQVEMIADHMLRLRLEGYAPPPS